MGMTSKGREELSKHESIMGMKKGKEFTEAAMPLVTDVIVASLRHPTMIMAVIIYLGVIPLSITLVITAE